MEGRIKGEKKHTCLACNGLGEIGVAGHPGMTVGCFDCDYDGLVDNETYNWQLIHRGPGLPNG